MGLSPAFARLLDAGQAIVMIPESGLNAHWCSIRLIVEILASIAERPHGCPKTGRMPITSRRCLD